MDLIDGLNNERLIIESGVRGYFTPYTPVASTDLFFGRASEVMNIVRQINSPGQHSLLFGSRGVGKSSLGNIAAEMLCGLKGGNLVTKRCDKNDNFLSIVEGLLSEAGVDIEVESSQEQNSDSLRAKLGNVIAGVDASRTKSKTVNFKGQSERAGSPSWVANKIKDLNALFLLDEVDVIDIEERGKIAELVKQLSDEGSKLKLLIVGIAETATELTNAHPSVQRCLKETHLKKMSDDEIEEIVVSGAKNSNLNFSPSSIKKIVIVSAGYPHFAHLLALKSAEEAVIQRRSEIRLGHIEEATNKACGDAEGSLRTLYDETIRSSSTDEYKKILIAASDIADEEFKALHLRESYSKLYGNTIEQNWLNTYLKKIVSDSDDKILKRLAKGVYKFTDPRMRSYIRLANMSQLNNE